MPLIGYGINPRVASLQNNFLNQQANRNLQVELANIEMQQREDDRSRASLLQGIQGLGEAAESYQEQVEKQRLAREEEAKYDPFHTQSQLDEISRIEANIADIESMVSPDDPSSGMVLDALEKSRDEIYRNPSGKRPKAPPPEQTIMNAVVDAGSIRNPETGEQLLPGHEGTILIVKPDGSVDLKPPRNVGSGGKGPDILPGYQYATEGDLERALKMTKPGPMTETGQSDEPLTETEINEHLDMVERLRARRSAGQNQPDPQQGVAEVPDPAEDPDLLALEHINDKLARGEPLSPEEQETLIRLVGGQNVE